MYTKYSVVQNILTTATSKLMYPTLYVVAYSANEVSMCNHSVLPYM